MTAADLTAIARELGARFAVHVAARHPDQLLPPPFTERSRPS
jgi:hypothetical protein